MLKILKIVGAVLVRVRVGMITVGAVNNSSKSSQLFEVANVVAASFFKTDHD